MLMPANITYIPIFQNGCSVLMSLSENTGGNEPDVYRVQPAGAGKKSFYGNQYRRVADSDFLSKRQDVLIYYTHFLPYVYFSMAGTRLAPPYILDAMVT